MIALQCSVYVSCCVYTIWWSTVYLVMCVCVMDCYVLYCICGVVCVFLRVVCIMYMIYLWYVLYLNCVIVVFIDVVHAQKKQIRVRYVSKKFQFVQNVLLKRFQHILNVSKYFENILCGLWKKAPKTFSETFLQHMCYYSTPWKHLTDMYNVKPLRNESRVL